MGIQTSNHAGVVGVYSNPANIVDNRLKFDMTLFGIHATADNNYVGVKRSAIKASDKTKVGFLNVPSFTGGTCDTVRRESPSYWKNNFIVHIFYLRKSRNFLNKSIIFLKF